MTTITPTDIRHVYALIASRIRTTPTVVTNGADFGLAAVPVIFKLELVQHAGSFKTRGAFAHLLTRAVPAAGVIAASGGNHGAAVAYAAHQVGVPAKIFVPTVSSPAKIARIRACGADLEIVGDRYADALSCPRVATPHLLHIRCDRQLNSTSSSLPVDMRRFPRSRSATR